MPCTVKVVLLTFLPSAALRKVQLPVLPVTQLPAVPGEKLALTVALGTPPAPPRSRTATVTVATHPCLVVLA